MENAVFNAPIKNAIKVFRGKVD